MNEIDTIICRNDAKEVVIQIKEKLSEIDIKDVYLIDSSDNEVVVLVSSHPITKQVANAFWLGYKKALE